MMNRNVLMIALAALALAACGKEEAKPAPKADAPAPVAAPAPAPADESRPAPLPPNISHGVDKSVITTPPVDPLVPTKFSLPPVAPPSALPADKP